MSGSNQNIEKAAEAAREHLMRSKIYKIVALIFVCGAIGIVLFYYTVLAKGDPMHVIHNPMIVAVLLLPFAPSWFLAILSKKRRAKAAEILRAHRKAQEKAGKAA